METLELNADFSKRAFAHGGKLDWLASPMKGVERRMLERIGDEVARATTIVRFAPESKFSPHIHTGGEEFLVLDGVFQDEHGDYPKGSYIRNPPMSKHTPGSKEGCTILVKLWQMKKSDARHVVADTNAASFMPAEDRANVTVSPLFSDDRENVRMEKWSADKEIAFVPEGGMEIFVIEGSFEEAGETFEAQSWLRLPVSAPLKARTGKDGALLWVKEGHLATLGEEAFSTHRALAG